MSTTVVETYDAQMLDYPSDLDVPMHASSDPWFQNEATMEEDGHPLHLQKSTSQEASDITIEVDMESYEDEQTTEYEMEDDIAHYEPNPGSVDVEVHGADSPAHSHDVSHPVSLHSLPSTIHGSEHLPLLQTDQLTHTAGHAPESDQPQHYFKPVSNDLAGPSSGSVTIPSVPPESVVVEEKTWQSETHAIPLSVDGQQTDSDQAAQEVVTESAAGLPDAVQNEYTATENNHSHVGATSLSVGGDEVPIPPTGEETSEHLLEYDHSEGAVKPETRHVSTEPSGSSSGDPHEISEGVYIDPPPPVLLSLSDQAELSLFNEFSTSGSSDLDNNQESHTAHVLLQHLPTLYYEPLSSVFDALREDEYITGIPEYSEGELIFDFYDLQLLISEDNVHTQEVTLHDLNNLHDSLGISGPLRVRLQTVVPRFIVRYHTLQEQVSRLNIGQRADDFSKRPSGQQPNQLQEQPGEDISNPTNVTEGAQEQYEEVNLREEVVVENYAVSGTDANTDQPGDIHTSLEELSETTATVVTETNDTENLIHTSQADSDDVEAEPSDVTPTNQNDEGVENDATEDDVGVEGTVEEGEVEETAEGNEAEGVGGDDVLEEGGDSVETEEDISEGGHNEVEEVYEDYVAEGNLQEDADHESTQQNAEDEEAEEDNSGNIHDQLHTETTADHTQTLRTSAEVPVLDVNQAASYIPPHDAESNIDEEYVEDGASEETHTELSTTAEDESYEQGQDAEEPSAPITELTEKDNVGGSSSTLTDEPELEDPAFAEEDWDDDLDGEGDIDAVWEAENAVSTGSNDSSVTLSSKRSFDEAGLDPDNDDDLEESAINSPGKRARVA
ncbi:hypothetical protein BDQ12DRAFT_719621 [Crucibulum laeve]|uniref:Uncharacterized protein n=1 Tax=Crucibulum laeve TaxID=68775 RepID=A0A5C3MFY2_9AGAR|nr:hypothetical protein BDQ12DRAFT_719621 [Crucibulum laeve]